MHSKLKSFIVELPFKSIFSSTFVCILCLFLTDRFLI